MTRDDSDTRRSESWHATSTDELCSALATDETGLSADEAAHRLSEYGTNDIHDAERESALSLLVSQFPEMSSTSSRETRFRPTLES